MHIVSAVASAALVAALVLPAPASAQEFPDRPIRFVLGFPPGGGSDVPARIVSPRLGEVLRQPVLVENRTGAGGYIGAQMVAKSPPDGYTIYGCTIATHGIGPGVNAAPPVDAERDFSFVGMIGFNPNALMIHPSLPVRTVPEFIDWVKAGKGKVSYAAAGVGGSPHLSMEWLKQLAGIDIAAVAYRGDAPARADVIAGHIPAMFGSLGPSLGAIRGGQVRALAVTSPKRDPSLPEVPTMQESGFPGFAVISWLGMCAPAGTPESALETLNGALNKVLNQPEVRAQLRRSSVEADPMSRAEFAAYVRSEIAKWRKIARDAGITVELGK